MCAIENFFYVTLDRRQMNQDLDPGQASSIHLSGDLVEIVPNPCDLADQVPVGDRNSPTLWNGQWRMQEWLAQPLPNEIRQGQSFLFCHGLPGNPLLRVGHDVDPCCALLPSLWHWILFSPLLWHHLPSLFLAGFQGEHPLDSPISDS